MDDGTDRQLNLHMDPDAMAGVYANFANISFSDYEFTITFARVDFDTEAGEIPGVVVSRINLSAPFMRQLVEAINDSWSKWQIREGIRGIGDLPEADPRDDD